MPRQIFLTLLLVAIVTGVIYGSLFVPRHLSGFIHLLLGPREDVEEVIKREDSPFALPKGFEIEIFARDLDKPRVLHVDPQGTLLVSDTARGEIVALPDRNRDGVADENITVLDGLDRPHGILIRCELDALGVEETCTLYVAETDQLSAYSYDKRQLQASNRQELLGLPRGGNHFTRTILEHPEGKELLVSIGSSCNVCEERDERRAAILSVPFRGGNYSLFAEGLRNAVFMTIHPLTSDVWVTEMGRDHLGDDVPPDEINIVRRNENYGWPLCYGKNIHDTNFDDNTYIRNPCEDFVPSHIDIQAHSAPLGLSFVPDGTLFISDDFSGVIYRVVYQEA